MSGYKSHTELDKVKTENGMRGRTNVFELNEMHLFGQRVEVNTGNIVCGTT